MIFIFDVFKYVKNDPRNTESLFPGFTIVGVNPDTRITTLYTIGCRCPLQCCECTFDLSPSIFERRRVIIVIGLR